MAITVKLKELIASVDALRALGDVNEIPAPTAFRVARAIRKARSEIITYDEQRMKLLKATGLAVPHPHAAGAMWIDPVKYPEKVEELDAQVLAMQEVDVSIEVAPIKLAEFKGANMKPNWLADLAWLIIE